MWTQLSVIVVLLVLKLAPGEPALTVRGENQTLPGTNIQTTAFLVCEIVANFVLGLDTVESRWELPDGRMIENGQSFAQYQISQGQGVREYESILLVRNLIYTDANVYTCEVRNISDSNSLGPWISAQVHLQLLVELTANISELVTYDNETEIELKCEMSLYLRPDEHLQWFRGGQLIGSETERYTVTYSDGRSELLGQFGENRAGPSRVSTLTISEPQLSDSGVYTCAIRDTDQSQDIQVTIVQENPGNETTLEPPTGPMYTIQGCEVGFPGHPPGLLHTQVLLACVIKPSVPTYESQWILPNGSVISSSKSRHTVQQIEQRSGVNLLLHISAVSYADAGVYMCRSRDTNDASPEWISSSIELRFPVYLEEYPVNLTNLTVLNNVTEVKLNCEMSEYLRPDEDLQWFRGDQLITNGTKYTITFQNGDGQGQIGGTVIGPSRLSTLTISEPQLMDSGAYSCAIRDTDQSRKFGLIVEGEKSTEEPADSDLLLPVIYASTGGALVMVIVLMVLVCVCCIALCTVKCKAGKQKATEEKTYDTIPADIPHNFSKSVNPLLPIETNLNPAYSAAKDQNTPQVDLSILDATINTSYGASQELV